MAPSSRTYGSREPSWFWWASWATAVAMLALPLIQSESLAAVFEPVQNDRVARIYANGQAIAVARGDSSYTWLVLESCDVVGTRYLRLWCMYQNLRSTPVLFEPQLSCALEIRPLSDAARVTVGPESPAHLLKQVSAAKNNDLILAAIGGALMAASSALNTQPTRVSGTGNAAGTGYVVNDAYEKTRAEARSTANTTGALMGAIERSYEVFRSSVTEGVLRKNTVFPNSAVNGYIYFPRFESNAWRKQIENERSKDRWERVRTVEQAIRHPEKDGFKVAVVSLADTMEVVFNPIADE